MLPFDDESVPLHEIERRRFEMERAWNLRQENILPLETAWKEGRLYGLTLNGAEPLTFFQRAGIFQVGVQAVGLAPIMFALDSLRARALPYALIALLGLRFCWVAIRRLPLPPSNAKELEDSQ